MLIPDRHFLRTFSLFLGFSVFITVLSLVVQAMPGNMDAQFGPSGKVLTALGGNSPDGCGAIVFPPDGKIIVAGGKGSSQPERNIR